MLDQAALTEGEEKKYFCLYICFKKNISNYCNDISLHVHAVFMWQKPHCAVMFDPQLTLLESSQLKAMLQDLPQNVLFDKDVTKALTLMTEITQLIRAMENKQSPDWKLK